jgi:hypothetical protein
MRAKKSPVDGDELQIQPYVLHYMEVCFTGKQLNQHIKAS